MERAAATLRQKLAAYLALRGRARLAWLRGQPGASPPELAVLRRWLCEGWGQEALAEVESSGVLAPEATAALRVQLDGVAVDVACESVERDYRGALDDPDGRGPLAPRLQRLLDTRDGRARAGLAREFEAALRVPAARRAEGLRRAGAPQPPPPAWTTALEGTLRDAARELSPWLCRDFGGGSWHGLLCAMRGPGQAGLAAPASRPRAMAAGLHAMGLSAELSRGVHLEPNRGQLWPHGEVWALVPGRDVRIAFGGVDHGLWSDLAAAEAVAAALCAAMVSPAVPPEQAHQPGASGAVGGLYLQLQIDPGYLAAIHGLRGRQAGELRRRAAAVWLCSLCLHWALESPPEDGSLRVRCEALRGWLAETLGCEWPDALLHALWPPPGPGRVHGACAGLAIHVGLRERFDEDWYRNPRAIPVLRGAAARGGGLDIDALCAELSVGPGEAEARLRELLD